MQSLDGQADDLINISILVERFKNILELNPVKVVGVNGDWGVGKTFFIKEYEKTLSEDSYIHIDAFEKDYESNPFLVILEAVVVLLKKQKSDDAAIKNFIASSKDFFINMLQLTGKFVVSKFVGSHSNNDSNLMSYSESTVDNIFNNILTVGSKTNPRDDLFEKLDIVTKGLSKPLIIVIDELDRCRPDFALELLEKIKHVFAHQKLNFILVYNKRALCKTIEHAYGLENMGNAYLDKFIGYEYQHYLLDTLHKWWDAQIDLKFESEVSTFFRVNYLSTIVQLKKKYNLNLRTIERLIAQILTHRFFAPNSGAKMQEELSCVIAGELLKLHFPDLFEEIIRCMQEKRTFPAGNVKSTITYNHIKKLCLDSNDLDLTDIFYQHFL